MSVYGVIKIPTAPTMAEDVIMAQAGVIRGRTDYICGKDDIFFNGDRIPATAVPVTSLFPPFPKNTVISCATVRLRPEKEKRAK